MTASRWERFLRSAGVTYLAVIVITLSFLIGQVLSSKYNLVYYYSSLSELVVFDLSVNDEERGAVIVPNQLNNLKAGDKVRLSTTLPARLQDNILIKTVHSTMNLNINNQEFYFFGAAGTYPDFQGEPPTEIGIVSLPNGNEPLSVSLEYTIPVNNNTLTIPQILTGDKSLLLNTLIERNAVAFGLAFAQVFAGLIIAVVGITMTRRIEEGWSLIWLGAICFFTGLCASCANDILIYLIPHAALLYNLTHVTYMVLPVLFACFGLALMRPRKRLPLEIAIVVLCLYLPTAIIVDVAGLIPFSASTQLVLVLAPLLIALFIAYIVFEQVRYRNPMTTQLAFSCGLIVLFYTLDFVSNSLDIIQPDGIVFQVGLIPFIAQLGIVSWRRVSSAFDEAERSRVLELEMSALNSSLDHQHKLFEKLSSDNTEVLRMRHDLRHQLSALRGLVLNDKNAEALDYIDSVSDDIPQITDMYLCENYVVNALCVHYLNIANGNKIQTDINLDVPKEVGAIADNDLNIIIGNLFENSIEACEHVEESKRFIKLQTHVDNKRFMLTLDNSFDGKVRVNNGIFYSRKRSGKGVGTASIKAVVAKYNGTVKFETAGGAFKVSLYLTI